MENDGLTCETLVEWEKQVLKFRVCFSRSDIMCSQKRRAGLLKGFTVLFLRLKLPTEDQAEAKFLYDTHMEEYARRETMIVAHGRELK